MTFSEDNSVTDLEVCLSHNNFSVLRQDGNHREGGFAVFISNKIRYRVRPELSKGYIESLWIELFPNSKKKQYMLCVQTTF